MRRFLGKLLDIVDVRGGRTVKNFFRQIKSHWKHLLIGLVTGLLNGLFGSGGGVIVVTAMEKFLRIGAKKSHSTAIAIVLILSLTSSFFYLKSGFLDWHILLTALGGCLGGFIGAKLLQKIPKKWLKIGFGAAIIVSAIKMIV